MTENTDIRVLPTTDDVAQAAAALIAGRAARAIQARDCFHLCLAGGSTPRATYSLLASQYKDAIRWAAVRIYFGDERCVAPDHSDSNYKMVTETLLSHVQLNPDHVHRIPVELCAATAADTYEQLLHSHFSAPDARFDLVLLGMGTDGHTASLFPHTDAVKITDRWCVANSVPQLGVDRITLTYPIINAASTIMFLVTGTEKAETLQSVLDDPVDAMKHPAQGVRPEHGRLCWLIDQSAAALWCSNGRSL